MEGAGLTYRTRSGRAAIRTSETALRKDGATISAVVAGRRQCPTPTAKTPKSNNKQATADSRRTSNLRRLPLDDVAHTNPTMLAAAATAPMTT
jgi:hypothetical protein